MPTKPDTATAKTATAPAAATKRPNRMSKSKRIHKRRLKQNARKNAGTPS